MSLSESLTTMLLQISEALLLISGAVLVVGLYFENKVRSWHPKAEFFALLVLIGCGGELIADGGVVIFSEHLQGIEKTRISDLATQADEATSKATSAKDTANSANTVARIANGVANAANSTAGVAKNKADGAALAADRAGVSARLADDSAKHLALLQLHFAGEAQHRNLVPIVFDSLRESKEPPTVHITCFGTRGCEFADPLTDALKGLGWEVSLDRKGSLGGAPVGIEIVNKWIDSGKSSIGGVNSGEPGNTNVNPMELLWEKEYSTVPETQRNILLKLGVGLCARLRKNPKLDGNFLEISVGL